MGNIDRRILYLIAMLVMAVPLFVDVPLPVADNPNSDNFFRYIQELEQTDENPNMIFLSANFSPDTRGESLPQARAIIRHLLVSGKKFAIFTFNGTSAPGQEMANRAALQIAEELREQGIDRRYGRDWVNLGFRPASLAILQSLPLDIPGFFKRDSRGTAVTAIPVMQGVRTHKDIGLWIDVCPSATYLWIMAAVTDKYSKPMLLAPTSVMVPDIYPYVASGQVDGLLRGILGAAEYESLLVKNGLATARDTGTRQMTSVAALDGYIILLIIIGNVAYFRSRRGGAVR